MDEMMVSQIFWWALLVVAVSELVIGILFFFLLLWDVFGAWCDRQWRNSGDEERYE
jgi:hypothetical protein